MPRFDSTEFARQQRNASTPAEAALWDELRKLGPDYKFSRQIKIGVYFVDFCCRQHRFAIEVDGESHSQRFEEDEARDAAIREQGYEILHFQNDDVMRRPDFVIERIVNALEKRPRFRH